MPVWPHIANDVDFFNAKLIRFEQSEKMIVVPTWGTD